MTYRTLLLSLCFSTTFSLASACGSGDEETKDDSAIGDGDGDGDGDGTGAAAMSSGGQNSSMGGSASSGAASSGGASSTGGSVAGDGDGDGEIGGGSGASNGDGDGDGDATGGSTGDASCFDGSCPGTCEGSTCGGEWTCDTEETICTSDLAPFCGCDGVTFTDSSTCPSQAYSRRGECESKSTTDCNPGNVTCRRAQPECSRPYEYPEVVDGCWGDCIAITDCSCSTNDDCPDPENTDETICYTGQGVCGPPIR